MNKILLVEDEMPIRNMLGFALSKAGFKTLEAEDCEKAWDTLDAIHPDLILMDWMLPDTSGVEMIRSLREKTETRLIPIIMLTARTEEQDKITGLNAGADDYICKPFSPKELIARINAVLRRNNSNKNENKLEINDLVLDIDSHRMFINNELISLGPTEFRLLHFFMQNPERAYSRDMILNNVWGESAYVEERTVDVHILRLRKTLAPWGYGKSIETVHSIGYRFSPENLK